MASAKEIIFFLIVFVMIIIAGKSSSMIFTNIKHGEFVIYIATALFTSIVLVLIYKGMKPEQYMETGFKSHFMYDPKTGKKELATSYSKHLELGKKGWTHEPPMMESMMHTPMMEPMVEPMVKTPMVKTPMVLPVPTGVVKPIGGFHFEVTPVKRCEGGPYMTQSGPDHEMCKQLLATKKGDIQYNMYNCGSGFVGRPVHFEYTTMSDGMWNNEMCNESNLADPYIGVPLVL